MYKQIKKCRICNNSTLEPILDLGEQMLTGVFSPPNQVENKITSGPLRLVKCFGPDVCGLVQLEHSYDLNEMYGDSYGYRSGLNKSMVNHLHAKVVRLQKFVNIKPGDLIIDIGSNDSTTLQAYASTGFDLVGIDPTANKFQEYYPPHIAFIPDFFSAQLIRNKLGEKKARVITSFSMFYDLESPLDFMREVFDVLAEDGIWVFEQSYMPTMLATNSFDTVCHEHLEFYALNQIQYMAERVGFHILDVEFNDINGGSFSIIVRKKSNEDLMIPQVRSILEREKQDGFDGLIPFKVFEQKTKTAKTNLIDFVSRVKAQGKKVSALGASTKGNVLLQYCGFTAEDINYVGEVNADKFGCCTPGTNIPIIPEDELLAMDPDFLIVLPWHFRSFFITNPKYSGHKLVFPLPTIEIFGQ